jgi:protoporphyrinogen/coproporphyrinogen III oxidase
VTPARPRVAVIGGGLTGLATAWHLRDDADVVVLDAADHPGGEIRTEAFGGTRLDVGADAFLARQPEAERLVRALGFDDDDLVAPLTGQVALWVRGRLARLPERTVLGAPVDPTALWRSGAISPAGIVRAALEPLLPRRAVPGDRSVADLVGERFGREVVDVLVEPLLGGVYAGAADRLSAEAAAAPVWAAAGRHRSVTAGLREHLARSADDERPVFLTLRDGLGQVVERLAAALDLRLRTRAERVRRTPTGWQVVTVDGGALDVDQVVVTVPAEAAAALLAEPAPDAARELVTIRTASVAVVALAYGREAVRQAPQASGILVPRREARLVKAVTLSSRKWPHHAAHDRFLLRASVGRVDDPSALELDDEELAERVDAEVRWATGIRAPAVERLVVRWPDALPQYDVGHVRRVDRIRADLQALPPGLHLGGAALDGIGLAARARDAERLAHGVRETQRLTRDDAVARRS